MAYVKTIWVDDETVVNATRMNHIEDGIKNLESISLLAVSDTAPTECVEGDLYYNSITKKIYQAIDTDTWDSDGTDPIDKILYIVFSTKTTYSLDENGDLISVGGGGDEISIGTTEPVEEEKIWINPNEVPSGSLNPITNEYSVATDKAYSCNYVNNSDSYSTSEIKTNKTWIDGKPIYRKVYTNDNYSQNASETKDISFSLPNLDTITWTYGTIKTSSNNSPLISPWANANAMEYSSNYGAITSTGFKINTGNANPLNNAKIYIIFEYTKTTD